MTDTRASNLTRLSNFSQHQGVLEELWKRASDTDNKRLTVLKTLSGTWRDEVSLAHSWAATGAVETGDNLRCICSARILPGGKEETRWDRLRRWIDHRLRGDVSNKGHAFYIRHKHNGKQLWVGRDCLLKLGNDEDKREARALINQLSGDICPACWRLGCRKCNKSRTRDPLYINGKVCLVCKRRAIPSSSRDIACVPCLTRANIDLNG